MSLNVPFGEWLPDQPALNNPGVTRAHNVIPGSGPFYKPFPSPEQYAPTSLPSRPYAAISLLDNLRNAHVYAASQRKLFTQDPGTANWTDISRPAGYNTAEIEAGASPRLTGLWWVPTTAIRLSTSTPPRAPDSATSPRW